MKMMRALIIVQCWIFLLLSTNVSGFLILASLIEMTPENPVIKEFDTLLLNCTIMPAYNGPCDSRELYVAHKNTEFRYPDVVTISEDTAQFRLPNITVDNDGRFVCFLSSRCHNGSLGSLNAQYVHVTRSPLKPFLINCSVENWEYLVCAWGPNESVQSIQMHSTAKSLKQSFQWQLPGTTNWTSCPEVVSDQQCLWRSANFTMKEFCIKIEARNKVASVSSDVECRNPELIVRPRPPTNIRKIATAATDASRMLSIEWNSPTVKNVSLTYTVVIDSPWEKRNFTVVNDTVLNISAVPFTYYDVSIVALPSHQGFPSDETFARFLTASAVPSENPFVLRNFYSFNAAEVVLYWQPISERNYCGRNVCYYVHNVTSSISFKKCTSSGYSTSLNWNGYASDLQIISQNEIGSALPPSSVILVSADDKLFADLEVISEGLGRKVSVDWFIARAPDVTVESVMLFWCQSENSISDICKTPIQWQTSPTSQSSFNLTLDGNFQIYQFGISVKFPGSNYSSIKWARKKCALDTAPDPPHDLQVSSPPGKHNELKITWKGPRLFKCFRSFAIFYCSVDEKKQCTGEAARILINQDHLIADSGDGSFVLENLTSDTKYGIWIISNTRHGSSKKSEPVYGTTTQPWFTLAKIAGIVVGVLLAAAIVIFGLYVTFRCCDKYRKKFTSGLKVNLPPPRFQLASTSSEVPILQDHILFEYGRQPSQISAGSRDSGHYSFPPSSPAMLPLLLEQTDKMNGRMDNRRSRNCYQQTNFIATEKTEDDEGSVSSAVGVTSYKIVPNGDQNTKNPVSQINYILPEQINLVGNGHIQAPFRSCLDHETKNGDVNYCNDLNFSSANDSADIGYTKIEQIPTVSCSNNLSSSGKNSTDGRNEDSNLLFCFDRQPDNLQSTNLHSVPAVSILDELLVTLSDGQPLNDFVCSHPTSDSYPLSVIKVVDDDLSLHSRQAFSGDKAVRGPEPSIQSTTTSQSFDNGYLPHNRLFGID